MPPTLVVAGFSQLADALEATGHVGRVVRVPSTSALRDAIRTELTGASKADVVFLFADTLKVDTTQTLEFLVGKLSGSGWRVVILEASNRAQAIIEAHPRAGLLTAPHTLNKALAGLAGVGVAGLNPVEWGHETLTPDSDAATPAPAALGGWEEPAAPVADDGWSTPAPAATAAASGGLSQRAQTPAPAPAPTDVGWAQPPAVPAADDGWASPPAAAPATDEWSSPGVAPRATTSAPAPAWDRPHLPARTGPAGGLSARTGRSVGFDDQPNLGKVIVVCAPKGGVGKSTVVLNLGAYLGRRLQGTDRKVCVVDANFQQADSGKYLGTYKPNITDVSRIDGPITAQVLSRYLVHRPDLNMSVLLGPATPLEASPAYITGSLYRSVVNVLRTMYDYVIVDTPVAELFHDIFDQFVLPEADFLVVCVNPNSATLINTHLWLRTICSPSPAGGRDFDPAKIGILLNRAEDDIGFDEKDVQEELVSYRFLGSIPETKEWKRVNNQGGLVATMNYTELNTAFARVLYGATQEPALEDALTNPDLPTRGVAGWLRNRRTRKL